MNTLYLGNEYGRTVCRDNYRHLVSIHDLLLGEGLQAVLQAHLARPNATIIFQSRSNGLPFLHIYVHETDFCK